MLAVSWLYTRLHSYKLLSRVRKTCSVSPQPLARRRCVQDMPAGNVTKLPFCIKLSVCVTITLPFR